MLRLIRFLTFLGHDNDFTSDSDSDSTNSTTSGSETSEDEETETGTARSGRKRSLVEEVRTTSSSAPSDPAEEGHTPEVKASKMSQEAASHQK